jgi:hypothetical protein
MVEIRHSKAESAGNFLWAGTESDAHWLGRFRPRHSPSGPEGRSAAAGNEPVRPNLRKNRLYHFSVNYDKCDRFLSYGGFE